jgi:alpha-tubulin suppressor-like RCC1 family protein
MRRWVVAATSSLCLTCVFGAAAQADSVYRWGGYAGYGGEGQAASAALPLLVSELTPTRVDASNSFALALQQGSVYAWGNGSEGELGNGTTTEYTSTPVRVHLSIPVVALGEDRNGAVAIDDTGQVWAWGANMGDSLCLTGANYDEPVEIPGLSDVKEAWGGGGHMLFLETDGEVLGCGDAIEGDLGNGVRAGMFSAPQRVLLPREVVEISAGESVGIARLQDGDVYEWGNDREGQIGNGETRRAVDVPVRVVLPQAAVTIAVGGDTHSDGSSYAVLANGELYAWGYDRRDEVADGQTTDKLSPVATGLFGFVQIAAGGQAAFGRTAAGKLFSWGAPGDIGRAGGDAPAEMPLSGVVDVSSTAKTGVALIE